ncbi:MAG: hypothetical protein K8J31_29195 [Anaerolineae bacterium]|nr:hypothetical protein [Anaerolineae bacterium]
MDHHWRIAREAHIRRRELMAEADQSRLAAHHHPPERRRIVRIYGPALYRLGTWLMTWGARLQAQYRESSAHTPPERLALDHVEIGGS